MKYIIRSGLKRGEGQYWSVGDPVDYWSSASRAQTASARRFDTVEEAKAALDEALDSPLHEYGLAPDGCRVVRILSHEEAKEKAARRAAAMATTLALNAPTSSGFRPHRYRNNPDEQRFAEAWARFAPEHLRYLVDPLDGANQRMVQQEPPRDRWVSERIIQWLGTPVGLGFLRDLGFEKVEKWR